MAMHVLITGGNGFIGFGLARSLLAQGVAVRTLHRREDHRLKELGAEVYIGDIADPDCVQHAVGGCDTVFHTAARVGVWGNYSDYYHSNVTGTKNLIAACQREKVPHLVYTSTPSVVFSGADQEGVDESTPYPQHFYNAYQQTKVLAEKQVLAANDESLKTISLRPHLFGVRMIPIWYCAYWRVRALDACGLLMVAVIW